MRFEFEADQWHFLIEVNPTPNYRPDGKFSLISQKDLEEWHEGGMAFHSVVISSRKIEDGADGPLLIHYACGILLPSDPEDLQEELEVILDQDGFVEHVLNHWELQESKDGPEWKK